MDNAKRMNDKNSKHEIDTLSLKLKHTERQLAESQEMIARKDK